jgi:hypothetical protein
MKMSNKVYDVLKWVALIVFPAIVGLCTALSTIWGWPHGDKIVGTLAALEIFLGAILQVSNSKYKKTPSESEVE